MSTTFTVGKHNIRKNGKTWRPVGFNMVSLHTSGIKGPVPPAVGSEAQVASWGFNCVRLPISWDNVEHVPGTYDVTYLATVDAVVTRFTAAGIAVLIDMHQNQWSVEFRQPDGLPWSPTDGHAQGDGMPLWAYPGGAPNDTAARGAWLAAGNFTAFAAMWQQVAQRYNSNSLVIGFDILNEPYCKTDLKPFYEQVGGAIHAVAPSKLLFFEDPVGANGAAKGTVYMPNPPAIPNAVYAPHCYQPDWLPDGLASMTYYHDRAVAWNVPIMLGEHNALQSNAHGDAAAFLSWLKQNGIGWTFWDYPTQGGVDPTILSVLQGGL